MVPGLVGIMRLYIRVGRCAESGILFFSFLYTSLKSRRYSLSIWCTRACTPSRQQQKPNTVFHLLSVAALHTCERRRVLTGCRGRIPRVWDRIHTARAASAVRCRHEWVRLGRWDWWRGRVRCCVVLLASFVGFHGRNEGLINREVSFLSPYLSNKYTIYKYL